VNSTISRPRERPAMLIKKDPPWRVPRLPRSNVPISDCQALGYIVCCTQTGFGPFVATSTANTVAVLRTLPAIVISASDMGACCSASPSRRVLTLRSSSTSRKIAAKGIGRPPCFTEKPKVEELQMDWLRSEDLKEEMELTASTNYSRSQTVHSLVKAVYSADKTPNLIDIDQPASVVWLFG
jgi:hypothetical protein